MSSHWHPSTDYIVDQIWAIIQESNIMEANSVKPKIRAILKFMDRRNTQPITGKERPTKSVDGYIKVIGKEKEEKEFWRDKIRDIKTPAEMQSLYKELDQLLIMLGYKQPSI